MHIRWLSGVASCLLMLTGCGTTIIGSANPSGDNPARWADAEQLPAEVHGGTWPAQAVTPVAASRRVVMYVNPAALPTPSQYCSATQDFRPGQQRGARAYVAAALCDGTRVVSTTTAYVLTAGQTPEAIQRNFRIVPLQLAQALQPGANDPMQYYN